METQTKWFYVFRRDEKIQAVEGRGNMPAGSELEDIECIATRTSTAAEAIESAVRFDAKRDRKILS